MLRSGSARTVCFVALVSTLFVLRNTECATAPEPGDLRGVGKVTFPITCVPDVQADFARGVALLHSFFYEEARRVFTALNTYYNTADSSVAAPIVQSCHGPVGPRDRVIAYEKAMRQLRDKHPEDFEVQTFYAFAVLATGYATPNDTSLSKQLEAAGMLERLWKQNANHPGVVHYLIHSYDYPQ